MAHPRSTDCVKCQLQGICVSQVTDESCVKSSLAPLLQVADADMLRWPKPQVTMSQHEITTLIVRTGPFCIVHSIHGNVNRQVCPLKNLSLHRSC